MADLAGIDRTYASQIERGIANPSLMVLCAVANALDLHFIELVIGTDGHSRRSTYGESNRSTPIAAN